MSNYSVIEITLSSSLIPNAGVISVCNDSLTTLTCTYVSSNNTVRVNLAANSTVTNYNFTVGVFTNPTTAQNITGFNFSLKNNAGTIVYTATQLAQCTITPGAIINATVTPASNAVSTYCSYTFTF